MSAARSQPFRLHVGVAAMTTPLRTYREYQALVDHLAAQFQVEAELIHRDTYAEINALLRRGKLDMAFVCSGTYAAEPDAMDVLAAPVVEGKTEYHGLILVPQNSPVRSFADLRGKKFLLTDAESNTGNWYPMHRARAVSGREPEAFFGSTKMTGGHDLSILAIAGELADGAGVSSMVYDVMMARDPELRSRVRVIERSKAFPSPPVVVRRSLPQSDRARLLQGLVGLSETEKGRAILKSLCIDGFRAARNEDYLTIERPGT